MRPDREIPDVDVQQHAYGPWLKGHEDKNVWLLAIIIVRIAHVLLTQPQMFVAGSTTIGTKIVVLQGKVLQCCMIRNGQLIMHVPGTSKGRKIESQRATVSSECNVCHQTLIHIYRTHSRFGAIQGMRICGRHRCKRWFFFC